MKEKNDSSLIQTAARISTPLSLVSLVVLVLYGLYKLVLGLPIFSVLPANTTFQLLNSLVDKVFYLAVLALVLGIVAYLYVQVLKHRSSSPVSTNNSIHVNSETKEDLRLVDVSIIEDSPLSKLDFKVRNIGTQVAFLKLAEFQVVDVGEIYSCDKYVVPITGALAVPSAVYDIELSPELKGTSKAINISHSLAPNKVDRFQFTLWQDWDYPRDREIESRWYYLRVVLVYNETDRIVQADPLLLELKSEFPHCGSWTYAKRSPDQRCINHNNEVIRSMSKLEATRSSAVEEAISNYFKQGFTPVAGVRIRSEKGELGILISDAQERAVARDPVRPAPYEPGDAPKDICPSCSNHDIQPGENFCLRCGSRLPTPFTPLEKRGSGRLEITHQQCPRCRAWTPLSGSFCSHCGNRLLPDTPSSDEQGVNMS